MPHSEWPDVGYIVSAPTVAWAARPLAVSSPPVLRVAKHKASGLLQTQPLHPRVATFPLNKVSFAVVVRRAGPIQWLQTSAPTEQTEAMKSEPSLVAAKKGVRGAEANLSVVVKVRAPAPNPSIERTFQRPLRALWPAAHVQRWAPRSNCERMRRAKATPSASWNSLPYSLPPKKAASSR